MSQAPTPSVSCQEDWVELAPGRRRYAYFWQNQGSQRGHIVLVHGLGEHGGRYHRLAQDFASSGYHVAAFDQQGHGKNPGKRGCVESYDSMLEDIELFLTKIASSKPTILFGHSMGGNLVLNYALRARQKPQAVIASSPMIEAVRPPTAPLELALRMLMRLAPNFCISSNVKASRLMNDPNEQRALNNDELFHSSLSLRLGAALMDSGRWLLKTEQELEIPVLLTHGTNDTKTCPAASQSFAKRVGPLCQLEILEGHMHDPFRDVERAPIVETFLEFANTACGEDA